MVFEAYQAGEYDLKGRKLRFTAFRSSTSRRDPDFPEEDYVNRPEQVKNSELRWALTGGGHAIVLALTDADQQTVEYTRL